MESAFPIVSAPSILAITRCRHRQNRLFFVTSPPHISSHRRLRFLVCVPNAVAGRGDESGIYQQSQSISPVFPPKDIVAFTVPAGAFLVVTFVLWKVVEKFLGPRLSSQSNGESKISFPGIKWSVSPGTNLADGMSLRNIRESRQKLNEFAKELRLFQSVDMSGRNFGDDGLFFLAESLGYNQVAEEVNFSGNGITVAGLEALDGILQKNTVLKTLNLSGNSIGDEGAKVT